MAGSNYWERMRRRRLSRRTLMRASARAGVGAAGVALVGCGGGDDDQEAPAAAQAETAAPAAGEQAAAEQTATQAAGQEEQATAAAGQTTPGLPGSTGLLPGQLTAEEEAAGLNPEKEYRLRYHWSKLANLPGQADGPKSGGVWTSPLGSVASWNPLGTNATLMAVFAPLIYDALITMPISDFDNAHFYHNEPSLAESWEVPDPLTAVFHVRDGVRWQNRPPLDGRAMTMEDIKTGYDALREAPAQGAAYTAVTSIEASESDRTVRFNLSEPAAYLFNNMMNPVHIIVPPEHIGEDVLDLPEGQVGSGAFFLEDVQPGVSMTYTKNPDYWRKDPRTGMQLPYLDRIDGLDFTNQRESEFTAWETGQTDNIVSGDLIDLERAQSDQPDAVTQVTAPPPGWQPYLMFKSLTDPPFNDPRVRQGLSAGLDRDAMREGVYSGLAAGGYGLDWTFFKDESSPWGFREWPWTFEELGEFYTFNPELGNQLLDAAGFNSGNPLKFDVAMHTIPGTYLNLFLLMADQWKRNLGVQANQEQVELATWYALLYTKEFSQATLQWLVGSEMDVDGYTYTKMYSKSPGNVYGINDPDVDEWCLQQRHELDVDKRADILEKIRQREMETMWRVFMVNPYRIKTRREYVFNLTDSYNAWNPGWGTGPNSQLIWVNA